MASRVCRAACGFWSHSTLSATPSYRFSVFAFLCVRNVATGGQKTAGSCHAAACRARSTRMSRKTGVADPYPLRQDRAFVLRAFDERTQRDETLGAGVPEQERHELRELCAVGWQVTGMAHDRTGSEAPRRRCAGLVLGLIGVGVSFRLGREAIQA